MTTRTVVDSWSVSTVRAVRRFLTRSTSCYVDSRQAAVRRSSTESSFSSTMTVCRDTPREARSTAGQSLLSTAASRRFRLFVRPRAGAAVPSRCVCLCVCVCVCVDGIDGCRSFAVKWSTCTERRWSVSVSVSLHSRSMDSLSPDLTTHSTSPHITST